MSRTDHVSQVADRLERAILSGEYGAGDLLPSERDLSAQLGVSRSVVREALGRLSSLGLVRSVHGSGTRVEIPSDRVVTLGYRRLLHRPEFRLEHLAEVRLPLETTIAALAPCKRTREHLQRLQQTQMILGNARRTLEDHVRADLDFHAVSAEATGNPVFQIVLAPIQQRHQRCQAPSNSVWEREEGAQRCESCLAAVESGRGLGRKAANEIIPCADSACRYPDRVGGCSFLAGTDSDGGSGHASGMRR